SSASGVAASVGDTAVGVATSGMNAVEVAEATGVGTNVLKLTTGAGVGRSVGAAVGVGVGRGGVAANGPAATKASPTNARQPDRRTQSRSIVRPVGRDARSPSRPPATCGRATAVLRVAARGLPSPRGGYRAVVRDRCLSAVVRGPRRGDHRGWRGRSGPNRLLPNRRRTTARSGHAQLGR